jgi:hypothetical protein
MSGVPRCCWAGCVQSRGRGAAHEAILEAVDNVLIADVGDGGAGVEEASGVGPQGLVLLLLALRQVVMNTCPKHGALEVIDENPLQVLPGVDGVWLEALKPGEWC